MQVLQGNRGINPESNETLFLLCDDELLLIAALYRNYSLRFVLSQPVPLKLNDFDLLCLYH